MQKWCQYLSINGDQWHSSIILLTSDNIEGPYLYQGPVVISGFDNGSHSFKDTDVELVLGTLTTLPSRYNSPWASTTKPSLPNNIDPCVFYDEEGKLWMAYGSWSGGRYSRPVSVLRNCCSRTLIPLSILPSRKQHVA